MLRALLKSTGMIPADVATEPRSVDLSIHLPPGREGIVEFTTAQFHISQSISGKTKGGTQHQLGIAAPPYGTEIELKVPITLPSTPEHLALPSRLEAGKYIVGKFSTPGDSMGEKYFILEFDKSLF